MSLIHTAQELVSSYDRAQLRAHGLDQDLERYCFSATYPPLKALAEHLDGQSREPFLPNVPARAHVYVHFPFCSGVCSFCHFNVVVDRAGERQRAYLELLKREISRLPSAEDKPRAQSIYFGGGTPSLMTAAQISDLIESLNDRFAIEPGAQTTFELHPEVFHTNDPDFLSDLHKVGVNRVSIGVQDFDDQVLGAIRRRHQSGQAEKAIRKAKEIGFLVNIDLMTPLPLQTPQSWEGTLQKAFALDVDSVTLYTTSVRDTMALSADIANGLPFPTEQSYLFYAMAQLCAENNGFLEKRSRWFERRPFGQRHLAIPEGLEEHLPVLGFGCGAYGYANGIQYTNVASLPEYFDRMEAGRSVIWRSLTLSNLERLHREIVFSARDGVLHPAKFEIFHDTKINEYLATQLAILQKCDLISVSGQKARLTRKGRMLSDEVAAFLVSSDVRSACREQSKGVQRVLRKEEHLNHFYEIY